MKQQILTIEQEKLVRDNLKLAAFLARKFTPSSDRLEDTVAVAYIGLVRAALKLSTEHMKARGNTDEKKAFSGYARIRIRGEIMDWISKSRGYTPTDYQKYAEMVRHGQGTGATVAEVAARTGLPETEVHFLVNRVEVGDTHLDEVRERAHPDALHTDGAYDDYAMNEAKRLVLDTLENMPEIQQVVISLVVYQKESISNTAKILDLPVERVRKNLNTGLKNIHSKLQVKFSDHMTA